MIIGFAGRKQSGKSTAANALIDMGFIPYSFAQPLKEMSAVLLRRLGLDSEDIAAAGRDKEEPIYPIDVSTRHLLQTLGTEWGRQHIHHDLWVMCAEHWLKCVCVDQDVVIDDVRFENEAALIRNMGGMIVHLRRGEIDGNDDSHQSEAGIACRPGDSVILNHGDLEALRREVWEVVADRVNAVAAA